MPIFRKLFFKKKKKNEQEGTFPNRADEYRCKNIQADPRFWCLVLFQTLPLSLVASRRLGSNKFSQCPRGENPTDIQVPRGILIACPVSSLIQTNWKPDYKAAAMKAKTLDTQSSFSQGGTERWMFLPTRSVLKAWGNNHQECLYVHIKLLLCSLCPG